MPDAILNERSPRGRPKDAKKRMAILSAAKAMFFVKGFEAVSMEAVAEQAGVARMTIYSHFNDKEALFTAVVQRQAALLSQSLTNLSLADVNENADSVTRMAADLTAFGLSLLAFLSDAETRSFNRLIDTQARLFPGLAKAFVDSGPKAVMARLSERLASASQHGVARIDEPDRAACQFIGMLRSIEALATLAGWTGQPDDGRIRTHVEDCVDRFMRAFG
ncbi:TetR/AcrR family transcriptional regulator [Sphingomonas sp. SUN019]|uniref:TetR/AcrR family transcriptional regulator n=1 Tax=Sphingomonas sp. SUN019 TaxID=2937788 RepID=UPI002164B6FB|nr:TetR/AcrR family transcriptional regulator [Sphingomonas sp. SUN019]UVO49954.1 TetR/AcrR family transcriptional regulator [Sphingomonas sp. SUN019]